MRQSFGLFVIPYMAYDISYKVIIYVLYGHIISVMIPMFAVVEFHDGHLI